MPVKYVVLNQGSLVLEFWTGVVSHDEVLAHVRQHLSDASIEKGASVLVDATSASFQTMAEEVHEVTDLYRRAAEKLNVGKTAVLVNEAAYARAQLYERQATDLGVRVILFNSLVVACAWLGIAPSMAAQELENLRSGISNGEMVSQHAEI